MCSTQIFESYSYQLVEQKQKFIGQIMTSKAPMRSAADLDETALSYAEVKALATGNPLIKECMELEVEVSRLKLLKSEHRNQKYRYETQISTTMPNKIAKINQRIDGFKKDIDTVSKYENQDFKIVINDVAYTEKKDAGQLLLSIVSKLSDDKAHEIGEYKGMKISVQSTSFFNSAKQAILQGTASHIIDMGSDAFGNIQRIDNMLKNMPNNLQHKVDELKTVESQLKVAKQEIDKPFEYELELKQKEGRLRKINHELSMDKKDKNIDIDDGNCSLESEAIVNNCVTR